MQDFDGAADALNRLAVSSEYLTENERKELAFELVFMHSINGDLERANNCFAIVEKEFEKEASLRIRAAYCILSEGKEKGLAMLDQAKNEPLSTIKGVEIFERKMLENMRKNLLSVQ
ncbi:MAG: hypothetical protein IJV80_05385 [Clostridia bacterium]|nr:hypothetical protein [Clostridia bacterium]